MSKSVSIYAALRLPSLEIEALTQGRAVVAMPQVFIHPGRQFALYPSELINSSTLEKYYRSNFLPLAQTVLASPGSEKVLVKAWATCELCTSFDNPESLNALSQLTMWTVEALKETFSKRSHILLAYLRVYSLPEPIEVPVSYEDQFVALPNPLIVPESSPVLSKSIFEQRKQQLVDLRPPLHPELEELQAAIAQLDSSEAKQLDHEIRKFLGWTNDQYIRKIDSNLGWINTITDLGNRSKEQDTGKSNYQAGTDFENIVRDSLGFLGFTVDYAHKGGAGGLDLFCSQPYSLVGECKAGKKIPNDTAVQLLNLGTMRLKCKETFQQSAKLIIGPGEPTEQIKEAAQVQGMAIINPETLEKLVILQSKYRGSVDLFRLKDYLKPGQADDEVEKYIDEVQREIKLRSQVVQAVKQLSRSGKEYLTVVEIRVYYNAKFVEDHSSELSNGLVRDYLVELSSPLTGYLGREKKNDSQSDRFYFLRDLPD